MKLPSARTGESLLIKGREIDFTLHPMKRTNRRWGVHSMLYAADPWAVMAGSISERAGGSVDLPSALSFVRQAREYFTAADRAATIETKPLLYYYSFLNIGKAISVACGRRGLVGKVGHGVATVEAAGHTPATAELAIQRSAANGSNRMAVDELHHAIEGSSAPAGNFQVRDVIAQSVVAHRLWREGFATIRKERFLTLDSVRFFHDPAKKQVWARLYLRRSTLQARGRGLAETLRESGLDGRFRGVVDPDPEVAAALHTLEQIVPVKYTGRSADVVVDVVSMLRPLLWQTVTSVDPYRRFYIYLSPPGERRLPQWLSIYLTLFWLGSLTRYQPLELLEVLDGPHGPFFREFLETQPIQLLYILTSALKQQDVTRASIV